ncbi:PKD domain-containing protein [Flavobacterium procerum]|uniref:PKD domain-containing protein n=1 Tax=Flavobacterium procerum TaxID=1455569 RepID=A0ABV6BM16_9FLAO
MDKRLQLKVIIKQCEQKFGRGNSEDWKHNDYLDFSQSIFEETKISISHNTLKRIFGKLATDKYYLPQQATFEALINYSGFNENEFQIETPNNENFLVEAETDNKIRYIIFVLLITALLTGILAYRYFNRSDFNVHEINLKLSSSEGILPKTCFFAVDNNHASDSLFIDFGDKTSPVYLNPNKKTIAHTYFIPGVFDVNLTNKIKENRNRKARVYVTTTNKKWYALGFQRQRLIPKSFCAFLAHKNQDSLFAISNRELQKYSIDTLQPFFTRLCNYTPLKHNADNFIFETTFKKDFQNQDVTCSSLVFKVSGAANDIRFHFVNSGCSSIVANIISEKTVNGTDNNLSPFVVDFKKENTIKLINNNKKLILLVNGKPIYTGDYKESLGDLRGVFVEFERNGFIKNCLLSSLDGSIYYKF